MKTYILTYKSDASNEPIYKKDFKSLEEATLYWSSIKRLNLEIFNKLYEVSRFHKE